MRDGISTLTRLKDISNLKLYHEFLKWLWNFFTMDGNVVAFMFANFARRCQCFDCLFELVTTFEDMSLFGLDRTSAINNKYLAWLWDTYENNKIVALNVLQRIPIDIFSVSNPSIKFAFCTMTSNGLCIVLD